MDFVYLFIDVFELAYRHGRGANTLEIAMLVVSTIAAAVSIAVGILIYRNFKATSKNFEEHSRNFEEHSRNFKREAKKDADDRARATIEKLEGYVRFIYENQKDLSSELSSYRGFIDERNVKQSESPEFYGYVGYEGKRVLIGDFLIRTEAIAILVNSGSFDLLTLNKFIGDYLRQVYSEHVEQIIEYEHEDDDTSWTETQKMLCDLTLLS